MRQGAGVEWTYTALVSFGALSHDNIPSCDSGILAALVGSIPKILCHSFFKSPGHYDLGDRSRYGQTTSYLCGDRGIMLNEAFSFVALRDQ